MPALARRAGRGPAGGAVRPLRAAAPLAAAALALAACGSVTDPSPSPPPDRTATPAPRPPTDDELLQRALDRRARAVEAGRAVRRARGLGLRDVRLVATGSRIDGDRARVTGRLSYGVKGVRGGFGGPRVFRARRVGDRWRVAERLGARRRQPWEVDRYDRVTSPHFVAWTPEGLDAAVLTAALEDGYDRMRDALRRGRLRRRYLVVVARDPGAARELTGRIRGLDGLTALTDTAVVQSGPALRVTDVSSQRLVVIWPAFTSLTFEQQRMTVAHELTHAALAPVTSGRTPGWLTEGLAMYVSGDRRTGEASLLLRLGRRVPTLRALSAPDAVGRLDGGEQTAAYAVSSAAAHLVAERYGRDELLDLYDVFNRERLRGAAGDPQLTARAVRRVLGVSFTALQRDLEALLQP